MTFSYSFAVLKVKTLFLTCQKKTALYLGAKGGMDFYNGAGLLLGTIQFFDSGIQLGSGK
ncbi:MAG: hypothetical protein ACOVRK_12440 [Chryseobacterium taeanense]